MARLIASRSWFNSATCTAVRVRRAVPKYELKAFCSFSTATDQLWADNDAIASSNVPSPRASLPANQTIYQQRPHVNPPISKNSYLRNENPEKKTEIDGMIRSCQAAEAGLKTMNDAKLHGVFAAIDNDRSHSFRGLDGIVVDRRVRPSALLPFFKASGVILGAASSLLGEGFSKACSDGMHLAITEHYNDQIRELYERHRDEDELKEEFKTRRDDVSISSSVESILNEVSLESPTTEKGLLSYVQSGVKYSFKMALWTTASL